MNLLLEEKCTVGMVSFSQSIENVAKVLAHPLLMIGSDSIPLYSGDGDRPGKPHPRTYGTFPRVLGEYAREQKLFPLETAVHKMTGMCAARLRLRDRGLVREGYAVRSDDLRSSRRARRVDASPNRTAIRSASPTSSLNGAGCRRRRTHEPAPARGASSRRDAG